MTSTQIHRDGRRSTYRTPLLAGEVSVVLCQSSYLDPKDTDVRSHGESLHFIQRAFNRFIVFRPWASRNKDPQLSMIADHD